MKEKLIEFCKGIGIEYVGIADTGPYDELRGILQKRRETGHFTSFEEEDLDKRVDPLLTMEDARSIIVCLFPYYTGNVEDFNISKYTFSIDYHITVNKKLKEIGEYLKKNIDGFDYRPLADISPLSDRYLAYRAGLGFYGINSTIINDKYGSYHFIGYLLNNYTFQPDKPMDRTCIQCGECVRRCPGNAILGDFSINPNRCISYITQKKGELNEEEIRILNNNHMVFGCDVCQDVCPHNRNVPHTYISEFKEKLIYKLSGRELVNMSNKDFKRKYGDRAFSWRGKGIIVRNFELLAKYKKY